MYTVFELSIFNFSSIVPYLSFPSFSSSLLRFFSPLLFCFPMLVYFFPLVQTNYFMSLALFHYVSRLFLSYFFFFFTLHSFIPLLQLSDFYVLA